MFKRLTQFVKEAKTELGKVKWPTKNQAVGYTKLVIIMSLAVAIFLGTLDYIFNLLITKFL